MKKIIGLLVALSMLLTIIPLGVAADTGAATVLVDGDNSISVGTYTYTATQDGTLYFTVTEFGYENSWGYSDCSDYVESYFGYNADWDEANWMKLTVNGAEVEFAYYGSVAVEKDDVVSVELAYYGANDYVQQNYIISGSLNLNYDKYALPELGSEKKPVELTYADLPTASVEIAAGATAYYNLDYTFRGSKFKVIGEDAYIVVPAFDENGWEIYDDDGNQVFDKIEAVDGVASYEIKGWGISLQVGNDGSEAATFTIAAEFPVGTQNNPAEIVDGENVVNYDATSTYYLYYYAECDATLSLSVDTSKSQNWVVNYYNDDYSVTGYYTSNDEEVVSSYDFELSYGDTITVCVWKSDYVEGTIYLNAEIDCPHNYEDYVCTICGSSLDRIYENKAEIKENFTLNETVKYVDITEKHTAVLGKDGYYHLDSADGAILYVDMDYLFSFNDVINSTTGSGQVYLYQYDENGIVKDNNGNSIKYNATAAVQEYLDAADENGYYPLTEDLIYFYQTYGKSQGWYIADLSYLVSAGLISEDFDADTAWMFACCYVTDSTNNSGSANNGNGSASAGSGNGTNNIDTSSKSPSTSDSTTILYLVIVAMAAAAVLVIKTKKVTE